MLYAAGFDVSTLSRLGTSLGNVTLTTAGKSDVVVDVSAITAATPSGVSLFFHGDLASSQGAQTVSNSLRLATYSTFGFATELQTALQAEATTQSWTTPSGLTVAWSSTTGKYTIAYSVANFTITAANDLTGDLLGFSGAQSGAQTYTSDQTPYLIINPTLGSVSEPTTNYEPGSIASFAVADDGTGYGIARTEGPLYKDWTQEYETKEKTLRLSQASTHPMTFQALFEHCRTVYPFYVVGGGFNESFNEIFFLREDGAHFTPERATPGNDAQFHIPFKTLVYAKTA